MTELVSPTPIRTGTRQVEGIRQNEMMAEETAAVAQAMAARLQPQADVDGQYDAPVTPGTVRNSRGGAPWVTWNPDPDWACATWFRLMDVPPSPDQNFPGARIVFDADDRPLGSMDGPLVLTHVHGRPTAFCLNTGWNLANEIMWTMEG